MLTAWDKALDAPLALPDFESAGALQTVRTRTRAGELVCPTCRQLLWLRAGEVRIPHFGHRRLSDCPHGRVSEAVLGARLLLYRFFQARIESGKLPATIVLEPVIAGLPDKVRVDLLLRRMGKSAVNVVLLERGLHPDLRWQLQTCLGREGSVFRPVFLRSRLGQPEDAPLDFLLDPTQRELRLASAYDLWPPDLARPAGTLHAIDPIRAEWTTLRGLTLAHGPQVFRARHVRISRMEDLLWSEAHSEWVHPGEAEALQQLRESIAAKKCAEAEERRQAEQRREAETIRQAEARRQAEEQRQAANRAEAARNRPAPTCPPPAPTSPPSSAHHALGIGPGRSGRAQAQPNAKEREHGPEEEKPLATWILSGLICVGCGKRTTAWQAAVPNKDQCICRTCFAAGQRLG